MKIIRSIVLLAAACEPAFAQSYRHITPALQSVVAPQQVVLPANGTIWYVRDDGGTRKQCDGQGDAAVPVGATSINHCAFGQFNYLFQDGTYTIGALNFPSFGWLIKGGDTVLVRGGPKRTGWTNSNSALDPTTGLYFGWQGDAYDGYNPPIPAGTVAQPTQILGENYQNCNDSNKTQIFGGFQLYGVLSLKSTQNVVVGCIELTRHSQCILYGLPSVPAKCGTTDDFATNGILTDPKTSNILLQNDWIHGFPRSGVLGAIGGTVALDKTIIEINGSSGWNFDDGAGSVSSNALLILKNGWGLNWNGCNQAYPGGGVLTCYSEGPGGYGDAIGTPNGSCIGINASNGSASNNIQDVFDTLHNSVLNCPYILADNIFQANQGEPAKWGNGSNPVSITGNIFIVNGARHSASIPNISTGYNVGLPTGDMKRGNDAFTGNMLDGGSITFSNNTIITTQPVTFDMACVTSNALCPNGSFTANNNIVLGYTDPVIGQQPAGYFFTGTIGHITKSNNVLFGLRNYVKTAGETYADPLFVNEPSQTWTAESQLDNFNTALQPSSPAIALNAGAGALSTVVAPPPPPANVTTPTITWATPSAITNPAPLTSAQLDATASVSGSFTYTPALGAVLSAGTQTLSVTLVPNDTTDFTNATKTVQLIVNPSSVVNPPPPTYPITWSISVTQNPITITPPPITQTVTVTPPPETVTPPPTIVCFSQASAAATPVVVPCPTK